jgi:ATP-dependent Zn protease
MFGEKKEWDEKYYDSVAIHESGHAYVYWLSGKKPSFMTIVSRGNFGGYMQREDPENTPSYTKDELIWLIRVSLAGRVAEETFFGKDGITTGIASDIQKATKTAFSILYSYAMSDTGLAAIPYDKLLDSSIGEEALKKVNEILDREMSETRKIVDEGKDKIRRLADYLRENNQATEKEIIQIFEGNK